MLAALSVHHTVPTAACLHCAVRRLAWRRVRRPWEEYIAANIFKPLGMDSTSTEPPADLSQLGEWCHCRSRLTGLRVPVGCNCRAVLMRVCVCVCVCVCVSSSDGLRERCGAAPNAARCQQSWRRLVQHWQRHRQVHVAHVPQRGCIRCGASSRASALPWRGAESVTLPSLVVCRRNT